MKIVIFGTGGQARETIDLIEENVKGKIVGLIGKESSKSQIFGYKVLGSNRDLDFIIQKYKVTHFSVAIGDVKIRSKLYNFSKRKLRPLSIISKKAYVSKHTKIS